VDGALGQEAVNVAKVFHDALQLTGLVLTKLDGDARGGAALSIKSITGIPIKFVGTGEKTDDFDAFYPDRLASRILGMGDVVSLVEKARSRSTRGGRADGREDAQGRLQPGGLPRRSCSR
jgi:signal recognition particle subunit SRP54